MWDGGLPQLPHFAHFVHSKGTSRAQKCVMLQDAPNKQQLKAANAFDQHKVSSRKHQQKAIE